MQGFMFISEINNIRFIVLKGKGGHRKEKKEKRLREGLKLKNFNKVKKQETYLAVS